MSKIEVGKKYYFVGLFQAYTVTVIRAGRFYSLCRWDVNNLDYGVYDTAGLKPNWRLK